MARVRACAASDMKPGEVMRIEGERPIALFNVDGAFYAIDDTCTHENYPLSDGWIDGDVVECALHMAKFCVRTGEVRSLPATQPVCTHPVTIVDGDVYVDAP